MNHPGNWYLDQQKKKNDEFKRNQQLNAERVRKTEQEAKARRQREYDRIDQQNYLFAKQKEQKEQEREKDRLEQWRIYFENVEKDRLAQWDTYYKNQYIENINNETSRWIANHFNVQIDAAYNKTIKCSECGIKMGQHSRYKCLHCEWYYLCHDCNQVNTNNHDETHWIIKLGFNGKIHTSKDIFVSYNKDNRNIILPPNINQDSKKSKDPQKISESS